MYTGALGHHKLRARCDRLCHLSPGQGLGTVTVRGMGRGGPVRPRERRVETYHHIVDVVCRLQSCFLIFFAFSVFVFCKHDPRRAVSWSGRAPRRGPTPLSRQPLRPQRNCPLRGSASPGHVRGSRHGAGRHQA